MSKILVYGLYVDLADVAVCTDWVQKNIKYAWKHNYPSEKAAQLVRIVTSHYIGRKEVQDLYEEFKND